MQDGETTTSSAVQPRPDESNEAYRQRMQERQLAGLERARLKQQAAAGGGANSNAPAHFHSDASDSEHDGSDGSSSSSSSDEDEEGQAAAAASAKADDPAADFPASPIPSMPLTAPTLANSTTLNFAGAGIDSADTSGLPALPMQQLLQSPPQPPSQRLQQSMHPPGGGSGVSLNFPRRRSFGDGEMLPGDSASQSGMSNALASPSTADALMTISRGSSEIPGADLVFMPPQPLSQIMPMRTIQQSPHDKEMQSLFQQQMQTQHMQRQQSSLSQLPDGSMLSLPSAAPSPVPGAAAAAGVLPSSLNSSALIDAAAGTARQIANIQAQLDLVQRMQSMEQRDNSAVGPAANNSGNGMLVDLQQSIEHAQQQLMQQQLRQERMRLQAQEQQRINALQQQQQQMQQPIPPPLQPYGVPPITMPLSDDPNVLRMLLLQRQRENEILREQSHLLQVRLDQSASRPSSSASMRELANEMSNLQWAQHAHQPSGVTNYAPYPYAIGVNNLPAAAGMPMPSGLPMATGYIGGGAPPYRPDLLLQSPTDYAPLAVPSSSLVGAPVDPHASLGVKLVRPRRTGPQLPDHERWTCPLNGCNKFFKKSSSNSIRRHVAECLTANLTANTSNLPADAAAVIAAGMPRNSSRAAAAQAARLAPLESPQQHHRTLSANGDDASSPLASAADESYALDASEDDDGDDDG
jgi:hypothetical protein